MRRRFSHTDNRSESELLHEAQVIFDSWKCAFEEIGAANIFGSKNFIDRAAKQEKKAIAAGLQVPVNVLAERAYFVDCLTDKSAAFAKRWENLRRNSGPWLGERRAHFKDRRKPRLLRIEQVATVWLWAQAIVLTDEKTIPPLCFMTDVAAAKFLQLLLPRVAEHVSNMGRPTDRTLSLAGFRQRRKRFGLRSPRFTYVGAIEVEPSGMFRLLFDLRKNPRWKIE